ncbi:MAG: hypothetical protein HC780_23350 [Leptolyngbyaceae cyanobacterium CSU_1_3]|nr:hypothetical protein [Leptolyngbyaceae cyanobacterium CSU_1_3]
MAQSVYSSTELSGSLRRHQESPNFWLAVLAGSLAVHLLLLVPVRSLWVRVSPSKPKTTATPIEVIASTNAARSTAPGAVVSAPSAPRSSSPSAQAQPADPAQPTIVEEQLSDRPCEKQPNSNQLVQKLLHSPFRLLRPPRSSLLLDPSQSRQFLSQLLLIMISLARLIPLTLQATKSLNQKRPSQPLDLLLPTAKPPTVKILLIMIL